MAMENDAPSIDAVTFKSHLVHPSQGPAFIGRIHSTHLRTGFYYFAPGVANGPLDQYEMCDWVDNAYALEVVESERTYGQIRVPMRVRATAVSPSPDYA